MKTPDVSPTILTYSGRYFPLTAPIARDIHIVDIAHALANVCRFAGHTREFYSVAQHSVLVSHLVPPADALAALLHDASEAYVGDVTRPLKPLLDGYAAIEVRIMQAVLRAFGLPTEIPASVKHADLVALATEQRDLMPKHDDEWAVLAGIEPHPATIHPQSPLAAEAAFLWRFRHLTAIQPACHVGGG